MKHSKLSMYRFINVYFKFLSQTKFCTPLCPHYYEIKSVAVLSWTRISRSESHNYQNRFTIFVWRTNTQIFGYNVKHVLSNKNYFTFSWDDFTQYYEYFVCNQFNIETALNRMSFISLFNITPTVTFLRIYNKSKGECMKNI